WLAKVAFLIYYYSRLNRTILGEEFLAAERHFKMYNDNVVRHEKALELLAKNMILNFGGCKYE
ncbi:MAG: hypothetical protein RR661_03010, partial [Anaerovoracaceae bacterium]